jgi:hypothetical protein
MGGATVDPRRRRPYARVGSTPSILPLFYLSPLLFTPAQTRVVSGVNVTATTALGRGYALRSF